MTIEPDNSDFPPRLGPLVTDLTVEEEIEGQDLAIVLSRYEIGAIERITDFRKGSRRAPKILLQTSKGKYLLKRRALGHDNMNQVNFAHAVQKELAEHGFPVSGLVETINGKTLVEQDTRIYELFQFIDGGRFDKSNPAAAESGRILAHFHTILREFPEEPDTKRTSFHKNLKILDVITELSGILKKREASSKLDGIDDTIEYIRNQYEKANHTVESVNFSALPICIVHGDWHPGNVLYKDGEIVGVIDFDSIRVNQRVTDVANGVLQFSIRMGSAEDVEQWPDSFRGHTIQSMVQAYDQFTTLPLLDEERAIIPSLMVEALIVESIIPIHRSGSFGRVRGSTFLRMVEKKLRWLEPRAQRVIEVIQPPLSDEDSFS